MVETFTVKRVGRMIIRVAVLHTVAACTETYILSNIRFDNISSLMQPTGARAVGNYRPMTEDILTFSFGYQMEQFF